MILDPPTAGRHRRSRLGPVLRVLFSTATMTVAVIAIWWLASGHAHSSSPDPQTGPTIMSAPAIEHDLSASDPASAQMSLASVTRRYTDTANRLAAVRDEVTKTETQREAKAKQVADLTAQITLLQQEAARWEARISRAKARVALQTAQAAQAAAAAKAAAAKAAAKAAAPPVVAAVVPPPARPVGGGGGGQTRAAYIAFALTLVGASQINSLIQLWNRESGWNPRAVNPSSGACGIPQSLPCSKMASAGSDYRWNGYTQIRWGVSYIRATYGTPNAAWAHSQATGWY